MKVENVEIYGLKESFKASKYPMSIDIDSLDSEYTDKIKSLAQTPTGTGHDNFLNGIIAQFDLTFSNKAWVEMQRYHFIDFVSSQSTMHKASVMALELICNEWVTDNTIKEIKRLQSEYNTNKTPENYLKLIYNLPSGLQLTARMTTNYRQLKTIYQQRKMHRLPEWREFCKWIEGLPYSELITGV